MIMTKKELAEELKVHINTISNFMKQGMPYLKSGFVVRFEKDKVIKWLEQRK